MALKGFGRPLKALPKAFARLMGSAEASKDLPARAPRDLKSWGR